MSVCRCIMEPTLNLAIRKGILGQYWICRACGEKVWEPIIEEDMLFN